MDDHGQMLVWEATIFVVIILVSLLFCYQLIPSSTPTGNIRDTSYLKIIGDNALKSLYDDLPKESAFPPNNHIPRGYPLHKLIHYLIINDFDNMIDDLHTLIPSTIFYKLYISNGSTTKFWCDSEKNSDDTALTVLDPCSVSHFTVAIHNLFLTGLPEDYYFPGLHNGGWKQSDLYFLFTSSITNDYTNNLYDVILVLWYV